MRNRRKIDGLAGRVAISAPGRHDQDTLHPAVLADLLHWES
jgi:hypothetical protein